MTSVHDLSLTEIPVHDPGFATNPLPYFHRARDRHPWLAKSDVGYLVFEYQAIADLYFMDDKLHFPSGNIVDFMGARGSPWGTFTEELMINKQGEEHSRLRGTVAHAFTPASINRLRGLMRDTVARLLDEWAPKGAFDFAEFAANFPIQIMCKIIGAEPEVVPAIREYLEIQGLSFSMDPARLPDSDRAILKLFEFVDDLIAARLEQGGGGNDLLDQLIAANTSGALSDYELRNLLIFLFAAGYDTSKNMLTLIMHAMLTRPEQWRRCGEDAAFCTRVVEEALRFHSVSNVPRIVVRDFTYRGVHFPAGTALQFVLTLSGRDSGAFDDPDVFDPDKTRSRRQLAFGRGAHICLGQFLARAQIEEGIHLMAQRITDPRLVGEVTWRPFVGVWGIKTLPIAFTPSATDQGV